MTYVMEGMKLALFCVLWSVFSGTECVWRNETCPLGHYITEKGIKCCLCPKGQYLQGDCSSPGGPDLCSVCEDGTYLDHVNSERKCEPCKTCSSNENMEEETRCSVSSNTVCRCVDRHYCDKGDQCKVCYQCHTCKWFEVEAPCTPTADTQCTDATETIVLPVMLSFAALFIFCLFLLLFVFRKKKMYCFKSSKTPVNFQQLGLVLLDDLDLKPFLPRIAEMLGFKVVRILVKRQGLPQSRVDNIMDENPHDASERAHQLLLAWYESHGMHGAYQALTENLVAISLRVEAERVKKLIQDG